MSLLEGDFAMEIFRIIGSLVTQSKFTRYNDDTPIKDRYICIHKRIHMYNRVKIHIYDVRRQFFWTFDKFSHAKSTRPRYVLNLEKSRTWISFSCTLSPSFPMTRFMPCNILYIVALSLYSASMPGHFSFFRFSHEIPVFRSRFRKRTIAISYTLLHSLLLPLCHLRSHIYTCIYMYIDKPHGLHSAF